MEECYSTLVAVALLHGCFPGFLNCINDTKSRKVSHILFNKGWLNQIEIWVKLIQETTYRKLFSEILGQ